MDIVDIPGFYYDADKKKYFRLVPGSNRGNPLTQDKVKMRKAKVAEEKIVSKSGPLGHSLSRALFRQETKLANDNGLNLQECVAQSRLKDIRQRSSVQLELYDFRGETMVDVTCDYLLGSATNCTLYGVWSGLKGTSVCRVKVEEAVEDNFNGFNRNPSKLVSCFPPGNKVMDMDVCSVVDENIDNVLCLTNHLKKNSASWTSLTIQRVSRDERRRGCLGCGQSVQFEFPQTLFSCAGSANFFAVGGEKKIKLFSPASTSVGIPYSSFSDNSDLSVSGIVTSLRFNNDGTRLFAGSNKGTIYVFDTKARKEISNVQFKSKSIVYLHLLDNQNQLIASGHDNSLAMLDIRSLKSPVVNFTGHVNSCKKIPVSVDESIGILCSSGDDSVVRFWSLTSGKPLSSVPLPSDANPEQSTPQYCWFSQSWKCTKEPKAVLYSSIGDKFYTYMP